jgi:aryl-alcohol dehydrogenase-like predicted oxidoreductase
MTTALNQYRLLGRSGLRVSPLCLGTMTFGEDWGWGAGKEDSRKMVDAYAEAGGNFIDTANIYTNGTSETFLGEILEGRRDQFVLATKFTLSTRLGDPNAGGNHRKNIHQSLEASLKRLRTDYIDLYWLHAWDGLTPVEETMRALDDAVKAGKVLYVGVSDMPAWKVAQANTLAELRGWSPYVALQIEYNLVERTPERDLIPMAIDLGLGLTPWSPLAGGVLTGKYRDNIKKQSGPGPVANRFDQAGEFADRNLSERNLKIADLVVALAKEIGRSPAQVALNWLIHQPGITSPIIGTRKVDQLIDNLKCLEFDLSPEQVKKLNEISRVDLGFPHEFLKSPSVAALLTGGASVRR